MQLRNFGTQLVDTDGNESLQLSNLDVNIRLKRGTKFVDALISRLANPRKSIFMVSDDLAISHEYINSLAYTFADTDRLHDLVVLSAEREKKSDQLDSVTRDIIMYRLNNLSGRRLHTLDVEKLMDFARKDRDLWKQTFFHLITEARTRNYILVVEHLHALFNKANDEHLHSWATDFFMATRWRSNNKYFFQFIAPLNWYDYSNHIENGIFSSLSQRHQPFLLTPRPKELSPSTQEGFEPDVFVFEG